MSRFVLLFALVSGSAAAEDWPQWRGPNRDGISRETGLLREWPAGGPELVFRARGIGEGFSSIAIADGRILTLGSVSGREWVFALDEATGAILWSTPHSDEYNDWRGDGPRSVPTVAHGRVHALGARGQLSVLDAATGQIVWTLDLLEHFGARNISWGISESPLVLEDRILVSPGARRAGFAALDRNTGEVLWTAAGDEAGYASPIPIDLEGAPHVAFFSGDRAVGIRPSDGAVLWSYDRASNGTANIATPVLISNRDGVAQLFVTSDYGTGGGLIELRAGSGGEVTAEEAWFTRNLRAHHMTPIFHEGVLYGFSGAILSALRVDSGELFWRDRGFPKGSLAFADGRLYLVSEDGDVGLMEPSRSGYLERGRFAFPEADRSGRELWSHPVVANGRLYVRDQDILFGWAIKP